MKEYVENKTKEIVQKFNEIVEANLETFMSLNKITIEDLQKNGTMENHLATRFGEDSSYKQFNYREKEVFRTIITVIGAGVEIETIWK